MDRRAQGVQYLLIVGAIIMVVAVVITMVTNTTSFGKQTIKDTNSAMSFVSLRNLTSSGTTSDGNIILSAGQYTEIYFNRTLASNNTLLRAIPITSTGMSAKYSITSGAGTKYTAVAAPNYWSSNPPLNAGNKYLFFVPSGIANVVTKIRAGDVTIRTNATPCSNIYCASKTSQTTFGCYTMNSDKGLCDTMNSYGCSFTSDGYCAGLEGTSEYCLGGTTTSMCATLGADYCSSVSTHCYGGNDWYGNDCASSYFYQSDCESNGCSWTDGLPSIDCYWDGSSCLNKACSDVPAYDCSNATGCSYFNCGSVVSESECGSYSSYCYFQYTNGTCSGSESFCGGDIKHCSSEYTDEESCLSDSEHCNWNYSYGECEDLHNQYNPTYGTYTYEYCSDAIEYCDNVLGCQSYGCGAFNNNWWNCQENGCGFTPNGSCQGNYSCSSRDRNLPMNLCSLSPISSNCTWTTTPSGCTP